MSEKLAMISAHRTGKSKPVNCERIGPDAVFGRLWRELGIDRAVNEALEGRGYQLKNKFKVDARIVPLTVLNAQPGPGLTMRGRAE